MPLIRSDSGPLSARIALSTGLFALHWATACSCPLQTMLEQVAKPHRGEGNSVLTEYGAHVVLPRQVELAQAVELLDPARKLFDAAVGIDRLGIAAMPGGATIDR